MRLLILLGLLLLLWTAVPAQSNDPVRSSPAYAEVLLRKTELLAEVDSLAESYTEEAPRIMDLRYEVAALDKALAKLLTTKPAESGRLSLALGKLMVRRATIDTEHNRLLRSYKPDHADVKKTKKRLDVFEAAIREILP